MDISPARLVRQLEAAEETLIRWQAQLNAPQFDWIVYPTFHRKLDSVRVEFDPSRHEVVITAIEGTTREEIWLGAQFVASKQDIIQALEERGYLLRKRVN